MRIDKLWIKSWRNLQDLSVDFDEDSFKTVLVGPNGTGKSNLLEALVIIFRDLDLDSKSLQFAYRIEYQCRSRRIEIDADPDRRTRRLKITVDGEAFSREKFMERDEKGRNRYLPAHVFGYYSGLGSRMEELFDIHQKKFYDQLIKEDPPTAETKEPPDKLEENASAASPLLRPFFYTRHEHAQFVLLAFFLGDDPKATNFLREYLNIAGFDYALFVTRQPFAWERKQGGDPNFWHAAGTVKSLLGQLYQTALAPLRQDHEVKIDFRRSPSREHVYLFLSDLQHLKKVAAGYESQQEFFKALESIYISDLLQEVKIRVKLTTENGVLTFRELSEGEQQLLMVLGLLRFTREEESLFLLDEPDTHLNPQWSIQYLTLLEKIVGKDESSHVILTSHNPLVVASLVRSEVQVMNRDEAKQRNIAQPPEIDPRGMGIEALLTSDVFGLRAALDPPTLDLLDEKRGLAIKEKLTDEELERLEGLNEKLGSLDFTFSMRDPLYSVFVKQMSRLERERGWVGSVLTPEQQKERVNQALDIVRRLTDESLNATALVNEGQPT